ncbi:hypothetical protein NDU88_000167 [Pleurodeles waltl]|uniref:Uncharacterized protein n=1 Tax=Pleurodeles waltl TaxID=8319 RepID=A0AAV7WEP7_PLEWA|nr:hypothetical protein NDU88_000167 [Pleurodeles waltl]
MDEALKAVFKEVFEKAFKDMIEKSVKGDEVLSQSVIKFDPNCPVTELGLNVLTKSDLLKGEGINAFVVDEHQKISTEIYLGKGSPAGGRSLQLKKVNESGEG